MNVIKCKRLEIGLTQKRLAVLLGTEQNTISQWESGKRFPRKAQLIKLASLLNCTVDELLRDEEIIDSCSTST